MRENGSDMITEDLLREIAGGLIVSCQAYPGEPMRSPETMRAVAESVVLGGARAVRVQGVDDIRAVACAVSVPVIGLIKDGESGVYITPTVQHVQAVCEAGAQIVALDGTVRPRQDGSHLKDSIECAHGLGALVMADCGSLADAEHSLDQGADVVATTLSGYTGARELTTGPDIALIRELALSVSSPVIAEGRISTPTQAVQCLSAGAFAVVVGSAITHPMRITQRFMKAIEGERVGRSI